MTDGIAIPGFRVGHVTDLEAATGCTVILCPPGTAAGVDVRGGAPGTRETALLDPTAHVQHIHALCLAGGSAFGLGAADGVMRWLAEHEIGYRTRSAHLVPIVPSAIVFDLAVGRGDRFPDAAMGYQAAAAADDRIIPQGSVGAGTGARVGAGMGNAHATKGGIGTAMTRFPNGLWVAALMVVNAVGDVIGEDGRILAGLHPDPATAAFPGVLSLLAGMAVPVSSSAENTVIGAVITNGRFDKAGAAKIAQMAHDGIARAVNPAHTPHDGDTLFALASGEMEADLMLVGAFAAQMTAAAVRSAVREATALGGVPALRDLVLPA